MCVCFPVVYPVLATEQACLIHSLSGSPWTLEGSDLYLSQNALCLTWCQTQNKHSIRIVDLLLHRVWLCNPMNCSTPELPVLHYLSVCSIYISGIEITGLHFSSFVYRLPLLPLPHCVAFICSQSISDKKEKMGMTFIRGSFPRQRRGTPQSSKGCGPGGFSEPERQRWLPSCTALRKGMVGRRSAPLSPAYSGLFFKRILKHFKFNLVCPHLHLLPSERGNRGKYWFQGKMDRGEAVSSVTQWAKNTLL